MIEIPPGDFYECREDATDLAWGDPAEAVYRVLEDLTRARERIEDTIARECPHGLDLYVWRRRSIGDDDIKRAARVALEAIDAVWSQEYGDPDGDTVLSDCDAGAESKIEALIRDLAEKASIWACERSATVHLGPDDVRSLCAEYEGPPEE